MSTRPLSSWPALAGGTSLLLAVLLQALVATAQPSAPPPVAAIRVDEKLGAELPLDTAFVTSTGTSVTLGELLGNGRPALLVLAYNRCSMLCSLVLRGVADLVRHSQERPEEEYSVVTISIDPHDTPHEAARTRQALVERAGLSNPGETWPFLVGAQPSIDAVAEAVGFRYAWDPRTEQFGHPAVIFAIDASGTVAGYFYGLQHDPDAVMSALKGRAVPQDAAIVSNVLNCFRFDTVGKKYGPLIQTLFQLGAGAVCVALLSALVALHKRRAQGSRRLQEENHE